MCFLYIQIMFNEFVTHNTVFVLRAPAVDENSETNKIQILTYF